MAAHGFSTHDYLVVATAAILMVTNLLGASFTLRRIWSREKNQNNIASSASWSTPNAVSLQIFGIAAFSATLIIFVGLLVFSL
jgi:hypothetical protein